MFPQASLKHDLEQVALQYHISKSNIVVSFNNKEMILKTIQHDIIIPDYPNQKEIVFVNNGIQL